jgi:hypothetical protein
MTMSSKRQPKSEVEMNTITFDDSEENWDAAYEEDQADDYHVPVRPRRRFLNAKTALLIAVITAAAGFYGGVRVEKGQVSSSSTGGAASRFSGLASRFDAAGGTAASGATGAKGAAGGAGAATGAGGRAGAGGLADGFAGRSGAGGFGGGNATIGTVSTVDGNTIYLTSTSGDTVKVTLSSATKVTKNETVGKGSIRPGDTLSASGLKSSNGTIVATAVSDTGAGAGATGATGATGAAGGGSSTSGSGGVSSLFSSGGGG